MRPSLATSPAARIRGRTTGGPQAERPAPRHADFLWRRARTRSFTLGRPRTFKVSPDGERVLFLRSSAGDDAIQRLWCLDVATGRERLLAEPVALIGEADEPTEEERRRRERAREQSSGIVDYTTDAAIDHAVFPLAGRVFLAEVATGQTRELGIVGPAFDPRLDPTGSWVAYVAEGDLYVARLDGGGHRVVGEQDPDVTWGLAEFIAAEEMDRGRGFWWSPDGRRIAAARVDEFPVESWYVSDPANPGQAPTELAYPAAGRPNARVSLAVFDIEAPETRVDVDWDREAFPYLGRVRWQPGSPLTLEVVSRRQDRVAILTVDDGGGTTAIAGRTSQDWVELIGGAPRWTGSGRLVTVEDRITDEDPAGTRRVVVDGQPVSPPGLMVSRLLEVRGEHLWCVGGRDPQQQHLYRIDVATGEVTAVTDGEGWHTGAIGGGTRVTVDESADRPDPVARVVSGDGREVAITSFAERSGLAVEARFLRLGDRDLPSALLLPVGAGDGPWPVLLSPYGGPHAAPRSRRSHHQHLERRWFADQGFAVLVVDGHGTRGRSVAWERAVRGDLATPVLRDQVDGLRAAAELDDRLDLSRVAIRGWSFGGFLAALAVLRRPDVFHAGIAGAPVTDWRLYDTYYTERYLGLPDEHPQAYRVSSLVDPDGRLIDAAEPPAGAPHPGLLLIHGLADDNVVAAHTLRLSGALLAAGRPHEVLPLPGVTHMTPQEAIAGNLPRLELDFLRRHLAIPRVPN